jgi:hypothetical protein
MSHGTSPSITIWGKPLLEERCIQMHSPCLKIQLLATGKIVSIQLLYKEISITSIPLDGDMLTDV